MVFIVPGLHQVFIAFSNRRENYFLLYLIHPDILYLYKH